MPETTDREIRRRPEAKTQCPRCGNQVTLWAETHEWIIRHQGTPKERWVHSEYGPATGECCGLAFLDYYEGTQCFEIPEARHA